ncbi:MAG: ABC transporter permease [Bacteroidales bacterium]|jgi:ABC-2 type transport system permease protein|nr:ABC transporter permease [Bacteroidales bacterium]
MNWFSQIGSILRREIGIIRKRPLYILGSVVPMLVSTVFFLTFLGEGMPQDLRIGIVDLDQTSTSRNFRQQLDATQLGQALPFESVAQARREMETGRISAFVVIPERFNEDIQANRCPKMGVYVNTMNPVIGGALAYKDILTMVNLTNGAVQREVLRAKGVNEREIMGRIQPVVVDAHTIGNGPTNYGYYLNNMILTGILAMCIVLVIAYSLASELKYGTSRHLLESADGSVVTAVVGKMVPYTVLFALLGVGIQLILFGWLHYPLKGSIGWMILAMLALVLAYEGIAIFIVSLVPTLRLSVCIGALYSVLGFSFAGFTLPISSLPAGLQGLSVLFPLRFYYQIFVREVIYGTGFAGWWPYLTALLAYLILPFLTAKRLENAYRYQNYPRN